MAHMRGCRADFQRWVEETGDARWSWDSLLPSFMRSETFSGGADAVHGGSGPLPVLLPGPDLSSPLVLDYLAAWEALGVPRIPDHNQGEMLGATPNSLTIRNGERVTVSDVYLDPVLERSNLSLHTGVVVHRLLFDHGRVRGVAVTIGDQHEVMEADEVILCGGSIGDPLLLMRSGVGDPRVLHAAGVETMLESPEVGTNLHDHLLGAGNLYSSQLPVPASQLQLSESMTYLSHRGLGETSGAADIVVGCVVGPSVSEALASEATQARPGESYTLLFGVTNPTSRGSLRISGPNIDDGPVIDPNYLDTAHDRQMFRLALEHARLVGGSKGLARWRRSEILPSSPAMTVAQADSFIARAAITHHHPVGTLRMSRLESAPVSPDLKFRGLEGLHVVDASVIPAITSGPVHAAVIAIAESFSASYPA